MEPQTRRAGTGLQGGEPAGEAKTGADPNAEEWHGTQTNGQEPGAGGVPAEHGTTPSQPAQQRSEELLPGELLTNEIEADLRDRLGYGPQDVTLQHLDGAAVICFEGVPAYTEDDRSFAVVLTSRSGDVEYLANELHNYPENFYMPEEEDEQGNPVSRGLKLVVDPDPSEHLGKRYRKTHLQVVPDARYAAQQIAEYLSGKGPETSGEGDAEEPSPDTGIDPVTRDRRARRRSSLYKTRIQLAGPVGDARYEAVLPPEHLQAIREYNQSTGVSRLVRRLTGGGKVEYPQVGRQLDWRMVSFDTLETLLENGPAIAAIGADKGGVGKSTCALNLALALAKMCRARKLNSRVGRGQQWSRGARVLLLEMNFENSCLAKRLNPSGAKVRGLYEYRRALADYARDYAVYEQHCDALRAEGKLPEDAAAEREPAGMEMPVPPAEPDLVKYTTELGGVPGLDVMFAGGEEADLGEMEKEITRTDLENLILDASLSYDIVITDLDKGRTNNSRMNSELIRFWLSAAHTFYLLTDQEKSSIEWATEFAVDVEEYFEQMARRAQSNGLPTPSEARLVPVVNMWREPEQRPDFELGGARERGADPWVAAVESIPASKAIDATGKDVPFIRVPKDDQMAEYNRVGKAIAAESEKFRAPFETWVADFVSHFVHDCAYAEEAYAEEAYAEEEGEQGHG